MIVPTLTAGTVDAGPATRPTTPATRPTVGADELLPEIAWEPLVEQAVRGARTQAEREAAATWAQQMLNATDAHNERVRTLRQLRAAEIDPAVGRGDPIKRSEYGKGGWRFRTEADRRSRVEAEERGIREARAEVERLRRSAPRGYADGAAAVAPAPAAPETRPAAPVAAGSRVVFVIDSTASMIGRTAAARAEVLKAVASLGPADAFDVLAFTGEDARVFGGGRGPEVERLAAWIETVRAGGGGRIEDAIRAGMALRPTAVWLATDGVCDQPLDLAAVRRDAGGVPVNTTTAFAGPEPGSVRNLWAIANATGGKCVGPDGRPIPEPAPPKPPAPPPAEKPKPADLPTGPSIFR